VVLAALLLLAVIGILCYRAWRQHYNANEMKITSPNGFNEAKFIEIHAAQEWITIRGQNRSNPVILFLHGGPAEANSPFAELREFLSALREDVRIASAEDHPEK
jgi:hypothetical protein